MRVLFYLPVVTKAWMHAVVGPLVEIAARDAEVHVVVPPQWAGTGIGEADLVRYAAIAGTAWHPFEGLDHQSLRTTPSDPGALKRLVQTIDPQYTFCRSADLASPGGFPGKVGFLMEGDFPPLPARGRIRVSGPGIFDHGVVPRVTDDQRLLLSGHLRELEEAVSSVRQRDIAARSRFLAEVGLPEDRPVFALPLEHDGEDNFYMMHSPAPVNAPFVRELAAKLDEGCLLALTVHPAQRSDPATKEWLGDLASDKIHVLDDKGGGDITPALARHCDGMILRDSKSFMWAALFGKPIFRLTRFASAPWLSAYPDFETFQQALRSGTARAPDANESLAWLGFHLANNAFLPDDSTLGLSDLIERVERPFDPGRWNPALERARPDLLAAAASMRSIGD